MALLDRFRRSAPPTPDAEKGANVINPAGAITSLADSLNNLASRSLAGIAEPLERDPLGNLYPFGPGVPLVPAPLDPINPATGRAEPRVSQYPVSWNLPGVSNHLLPWKILRDFADNVDLIRRCIEIRKARLCGDPWDITVSDKAVKSALAQAPEASRQEVENNLRTKLAPDIGRLIEFWSKPDRANGYTWATWVGQLLEEYFVLDAIAIYARRDRKGDVHSLELVDGSTIKPLLDHRGGRPAPPFPAYQQILYGFPRGEYTASANEDGTISNGYPTDELVYARRTVRTWTPYGYSPVEQSLASAQLYLRRQNWILAEYTEGTMPETWMESDATAGMTPEQLRAYEVALNDYLAGDTTARHRIKLLPGGMHPVETSSTDERYKPDYDLYLIKLLASHFDVPITELGFTEAKGLGGASYHEGNEDVQARKERAMRGWLVDMFNDISTTYLGMPKELTFSLLSLEAEDETAADQVAQERVSTGRMTMNEDRDRLGMARYAFDEADMPMVMSRTGVTFIGGASKLVPPGTEVVPAQMVHEMDVASGGPGNKAQTQAANAKQSPASTSKAVSPDDLDARQGEGPPAPGLPRSAPRGNGAQAPAQGQSRPPHGGQGSQASTQGQPRSPSETRSQDAVKAAELVAYGRYTRTHGPGARPFTFYHHTAEEITKLGAR